MLRTQIYLTAEQKRAIELFALHEKKPEAQVIRDLLDRGLEASTSLPNAGTALLELAELGKKHQATGPTDLSTHHDDYLYGDKK